MRTTVNEFLVFLCTLSLNTDGCLAITLCGSYATSLSLSLFLAITLCGSCVTSLSLSLSLAITLCGSCVMVMVMVAGDHTLRVMCHFFIWQTPNDFHRARSPPLSLIRSGFIRTLTVDSRFQRFVPFDDTSSITPATGSCLACPVQSGSRWHLLGGSWQNAAAAVPLHHQRRRQGENAKI